MDWPQKSTLITLLTLYTIAAFSTTALSDGISGSQYVTGRSLLQIPKECPISFEFKNYTIISSQCKGPNYPAKQCCDAFVEFACPFVQYLNNFTECSKSMFDYLNLKAHYPTGLFSSLCKGDKEGLPCLATPPLSSPPKSDLDDLSSCSLFKCSKSSAAWILLLLPIFI
ncbi:unnamed protein product [Cuscuta epithymum]|uniref:GPI-anchored protein LLG1-like domain-containing protein n=1 Tax=Cuscuta epithymum TaxID=186058 RepID=A0AAV0C5I7_9ASTE|nr:unnamed protein product [Cuscuta epithymum]CAH9135200.1 unnamed protein product [Cuscuta epithymum]